MLGVSGTTIIGRVCARGTGMDALVARLRLEALLMQVDLRPSTLNPSAILCVRHLRDPAPQRVNLATQERLPQAWVAAGRQQLEALMLQAARPAQEAVPAVAQAVIFADRAELLACLTRCWLNGDMLDNWWWQSLAPMMTLGGDFAVAWLSHPEYVPAALAQLVEKGDALALVRALPAVLLRALLVELSRTFGLPGLHHTLSEMFAGSATSTIPPTLSPVTAPAPSVAFPAAPANGVMPPIWCRWLPVQTLSQISPLQELFLGVAIMLHRARQPMLAPQFAEDVRVWYQTEIGTSPVRILPPAPHPVTPDAARAEQPTEAPHPPDSAAVTPLHSPISTASLADPSPIPLSVEPALFEPPPSENERALTAQSDNSVSYAPAQEVMPPDIGTGIETWFPYAEPAAEPFYERTITSEFGGLLYLLNVGIALNLYGDFTTPLQPGIALPIWDFLALMGRELVGEALVDDPLWALLADLVGRSADEPPGSGFAAPRVWRLPSEWLDAFPEAAVWTWNAAHKRLVIEHPARFCIVDIPRRGQTTWQLLRALRPYGQVVARSDRAVQSVHAKTDLQRWVGWLAVYLRARLERALGTAEIADVLFKRPAQLYKGETHVDVVFSLMDVSLEARFAGLDRNPGWIPAAGRVVQFYFSE